MKYVSHQMPSHGMECDSRQAVRVARKTTQNSTLGRGTKKFEQVKFRQIDTSYSRGNSRGEMLIPCNHVSHPESEGKCQTNPILPDPERRATVESAQPVAKFTASSSWDRLAAGCHATSVHRSSWARADSFLEQPAAFHTEISPLQPD